MSYTPNTWKSGDVVTSAKLNNIESGISNAVLVVHVMLDGSDNMILSETYNAIANATFAFVDDPDALFGGSRMWVNNVVHKRENEYNVNVVLIDPEEGLTSFSFGATSADGVLTLAQ